MFVCIRHLYQLSSHCTVTEKSTVTNVQQPTLFYDVSSVTNCWAVQNMRRINIYLRLYVVHSFVMYNDIRKMETIGHNCLYFTPCYN